MEEEKLVEYLTLLRNFGKIYTRKIISASPELASDLKLSQIRALYAFREMDKLTMKELAEAVGVKLPTMTMMIDGLVQEKIVERERDGNDRRKVNVWLTAKGKKIRDDFLAQRQRLARTIFDSVDADDSKELMRSLGNVCRILEKAFKNGDGD